MLCARVTDGGPIVGDQVTITVAPENVLFVARHADAPSLLTMRRERPTRDTNLHQDEIPSTAPPRRADAARNADDTAVKTVVAVVVAALTLIPPGYLGYGSLSSNGPGAADNQITAANWQYATGAGGRSYLLHTVDLGRLTVGCAIIIGTGLVWLIARCDFPGKRVFGTLLMLPLLSPLLSTLAWIGLP